MIVEPLRLYSVAVFDANAKSYKAAARNENKDPHEALNAMDRNLLSGLFGGEWDTCPGEQVVRTQWEHGANGWIGYEIQTIAGDDPDPNCLYHRIVGDSIQHRYRFHAPLPQPKPGDPPGVNLSNLEWWRYIGLNERHNLAMVIKPYLDDRASYWQFIFSKPARHDENEKVKQTNASSTVSPESSKEIHPDSLFLGRLNNPILTKIMNRLRKELQQNDHYIGEVARLFDTLLSQILIFCADRLDATSTDIGTRGDYRFRSDARESDLQSDLRDWLLGNLQYGEVGAEVSGVGTGRADICVAFDGIRFVVELKRENADANRTHIQKYIQQVVAYQNTRAFSLIV
jgi:hypothetical protein